MWQSPSSQALQIDNTLLAAGHPPPVGKERYEQLGRNGYLRYQYQTLWENERGVALESDAATSFSKSTASPCGLQPMPSVCCDS